MNNVLIAGGAGFIGSHFVRKILDNPEIERVIVYDNFSSGKRDFLKDQSVDRRLFIEEGDIIDLPNLCRLTAECDTIIHLASNPDIAKAAKEPIIDFFNGTTLTQMVLEAARLTGVKTILYASGSGVYGYQGDFEVEEAGPFRPNSPYGASKLAGEALLCAYWHMFGISSLAFRFANVVGPNQTHGVGRDFLRKLKENPTKLEILGDGQQSKSYIHVDDVIRAILTAYEKSFVGHEVFNVATDDYITVDQIAFMAAEELGLTPEFTYTGGNIGWKGDVPKVRFNTSKIKQIGWKCSKTSEEAMRAALQAMK